MIEPDPIAGPEQPIETAPQDGRVIEVWHGPRTRQQAARAFWNARLQAWVEAETRCTGPYRTLRNVRWWIP